MSFTTRRIREEKPSRWKSVAAKAAPYVLRLGAVFGAMYAKMKSEKEAHEQASARQRILKKILVVLLSILLGLLLLAGTVKALVAMRVLTIHNFLSIAGSDLPQDENGYTNILLLGTGDKNHDGVDLTDTLMVVSLDAWKTKSAVMLSIPRDLYVLNSEKMGRGRVNELYRDYKHVLRRDEGMTAEDASQAAMKELAAELGRKLGMTIHHVVKVDFTAFIDGVNTLGGVDIDVPADLVDVEYPGPNYTYETFQVSKGMQHMDGETALKYARSRHSTSDFSRAARQQQIVKALAEKAQAQGLASSPGTITSLLKILSDHVETTMSFGEILGAAKLGENIERQNVISHTLNIETGITSPYATPGGFLYAPPRDQFEGASVLLPFSIPESPVTWKQITTFMYVLMHDRAMLLKQPEVTILNANGTTGLGRVLGNELTRYGFERIETDNAGTDPKHALKLPSTVVVAGSEERKADAQFFADLLHMPLGPLPADIVPEKRGSGVTIVLGQDYSYSPLQNLIPEPPSATPAP